jgi:hypothetical protein
MQGIFTGKLRDTFSSLQGIHLPEHPSRGASLNFALARVQPPKRRLQYIIYVMFMLYKLCAAAYTCCHLPNRRISSS